MTQASHRSFLDEETAKETDVAWSSSKHEQPWGGPERL